MTLVLPVTLALLGSPQTGPTDADVRAAVEAYEALDFHEVVPLLEKALLRPDLSESDRRTTLAYLGRAHAVFRRKGKARATFQQLLLLDPEFAVDDDESPMIREAFAQAQAAVGRIQTKAKKKTRTVRLRQRDPTRAGQRSKPSSRVLAVVPAANEGAFVQPPATEEAEPFGPAFWGFVGGAVLVVGTVVLLATEPWAETEVPRGTWGSWPLP
ncbi:hypothetical protein ACFL6C_01540 [Myxococcota bacterium]